MFLFWRVRIAFAFNRTLMHHWPQTKRSERPQILLLSVWATLKFMSPSSHTVWTCSLVTCFLPSTNYRRTVTHTHCSPLTKSLSSRDQTKSLRWRSWSGGDGLNHHHLGGNDRGPGVRDGANLSVCSATFLLLGGSCTLYTTSPILSALCRVPHHGLYTQTSSPARKSLPWLSHCSFFAAIFWPFPAGFR